jgi:hypothetical protein
MHRIQCDTYPNEPERIILPCVYFDLMGGTDTGGLGAHYKCQGGKNSFCHRLLALLFSKCRMSVDEASTAFHGICESVYMDSSIDAAERSHRLRRCLEDILKSKYLPLDLKMGPDSRITNITKCARYVSFAHDNFYLSAK